jgi:hypothetical protein
VIFCSASAFVIEPIYGVAIPSWHQMSVDVSGNLNRRVSHLLLRIHQRFALLKQQTAERMPKNVGGAGAFPNAGSHDNFRDAFPNIRIA